MDVETSIAPRARWGPPETLADVLAEGTWRRSEDEGGRRFHVAAGGWRREVSEKKAREEEEVAARRSGMRTFNM